MSRMDRINQQIKREISLMIQRDLSDPRLEFVSITRVDVSPDLHNAKVYFRVIGNEEKVRTAQQGLNAACGMIRKLVGDRVKIRYTPELNFYYDKSIEQAQRVEEILNDLHNEPKENHKND